MNMLRITNVIERMRSNPRHELHEGAQRIGGNRGDGKFYLTYSVDDPVEPLEREEFEWMLSVGIIKPKWPDATSGQMYVIAPSAPYTAASETGRTGKEG